MSKNLVRDVQTSTVKIGGPNRRIVCRACHQIVGVEWADKETLVLKCGACGIRFSALEPGLGDDHREFTKGECPTCGEGALVEEIEDNCRRCCICSAVWRNQE
jgi:hypothetical protein